MADYRLNSDDESLGVFHKPTGRVIPASPDNRHWLEYLEWKAADPINNIPDPVFTPAEQAQFDYEQRQRNRIKILKNALVNQFKMILDIFQVGRDKGVWTVSDFDPSLVTVAQQWITLIDEYENDSP